MENAILAQITLDKMHEEAQATTEALSYEISNRGAGETQIEPPENFKLALQLLQEVRKENARIALLRRRELELLKPDAPQKVAELLDDPALPVGRELLDTHMQESRTAAHE